MIKAEPSFAAFLAIDWADKKHTYVLADSQDKSLQKGEFEQTPEALFEFIAKLQERFPDAMIAVGLEQSRGALIHGLLEYSCLVIYPIHPETASKFRQAFRPSGAKSDPIDADDLLEILLKHRNRLKAYAPDCQENRLLTRLTEYRRQFVDQRTSLIQAVKAALKQYFPQSLEILSGNVCSRLAYDFFKKWPSFDAFQQAKAQTIRKFLYGHNIRSQELIEKVLEIAKTGRPLTRDEAIIQSSIPLVQTYTQMIQTLEKSIEEIEGQIEAVFKNHPEAYLFENLPGAGLAMAPRLTALFGTDRSRFEDAQSVQRLSGIAPVLIQSGNMRYAKMRQACPKFLRQTFHEFARLSVAQSEWARNYVNYYLKQKKKYNAIIRALAFKWTRILFACWKNRTPYDEKAYLLTLKKKNSPYAEKI